MRIWLSRKLFLQVTCIELFHIAWRDVDPGRYVQHEDLPSDDHVHGGSDLHLPFSADEQLNTLDWSPKLRPIILGLATDG